MASAWHTWPASIHTACPGGFWRACPAPGAPVLFPRGSTKGRVSGTWHLTTKKRDPIPADTHVSLLASAGRGTRALQPGCFVPWSRNPKVLGRSTLIHPQNSLISPSTATQISICFPGPRIAQQHVSCLWIEAIMATLC